MSKKDQVPARAIFVQGSFWVWSATSRGRPPDGGLALAVFHMRHGPSGICKTRIPSCFLFSVSQHARPPATPRRLGPPLTERSKRDGPERGRHKLHMRHATWVTMLQWPSIGAFFGPIVHRYRSCLEERRRRQKLLLEGGHCAELGITYARYPVPREPDNGQATCHISTQESSFSHSHHKK